jgi:hypothetical protein
VWPGDPFGADRDEVIDVPDVEEIGSGDFAHFGPLVDIRMNLGGEVQLAARSAR